LDHEPPRDPSRWDARIARARELAAQTPPAREALTFLVDLLQQQRSLFLSVPRVGEASAFCDAVDLDRAALAVPHFLGWLERNGPPSLAGAARSMTADRTDWRALIREALSLDDLAGDDAKAFVVGAILQPFCEAAAADYPRPSPLVTETRTLSSRCPICSGLPLVGVLREEGQGARRALVCSRCLNEWSFTRVLCPGCGEERFDALPIYTADTITYVRIEACDSCRQYLKTIDLTRDGLAVPAVDDIATVTLDLWAAGQGYHRARPNLVRTSEPLVRPVELEKP
jgi:FdhE protein